MAIKMYSDMVTLQIMDSVFYEVQRQGRISFYLTSLGEEAINIASAAALSAHDIILPQVRLTSILQSVKETCYTKNNEESTILSQKTCL